MEEGVGSIPVETTEASDKGTKSLPVQDGSRDQLLQILRRLTTRAGIGNGGFGRKMILCHSEQDRQVSYCALFSSTSLPPSSPVHRVGVREVDSRTDGRKRV